MFYIKNNLIEKKDRNKLLLNTSDFPSSKLDALYAAFDLVLPKYL